MNREVKPHVVMDGGRPLAIVVPPLATDVTAPVAHGRFDALSAFAEVEPHIALTLSEVVAGFGADDLVDTHLHRRVRRPFEVDESIDIAHIKRPAATGGERQR